MIVLRVIAIVFGALLLAAAGIDLLFGVISFIDPVGAKGSDDNDPFGPPESRWSIAARAVLDVAIGVFGAWLVGNNLLKLRPQPN